MRTILLSLLGLSATLASAQTNVALGKTVTSTGSVNGKLATVTDGVFLTRGTTWNSGTAYWNGLTPTLTIDLNGLYTLTQMTGQFDDNDAYRVQYLDAKGTWQTAWDVPNFDRVDGVDVHGMQTRPNATNDAARFDLSTPITTTALRLSALSGDGSYSISEFQAFGTPQAVPEPASVAAVALGLAGVLRRRRKA